MYSCSNFYQLLRAVATNSPRPEISWTWGTEGDIVWAELNILSDMAPQSVMIKYSETGEDFLEKGVYKRDWRWTVPGYFKPL